VVVVTTRARNPAKLAPRRVASSATSWATLHEIVQKDKVTVAQLLVSKGAQLVRVTRTASEVKASSGRESYLIPARPST
jgi:hypothetical protein